MREGWERVALGEVFAVSAARLGEHAEEPTVFSISKYDGVVPADEYFDKRVASANLDAYKVLLRDMWAYSTIHIDEGSIARNKTGVDGVVSPMYTLLAWTSNRHLPEYFELVLKSPEMLAAYRDNAQGSINRRRSLSWTTFTSLVVNVPPLAEQRRIVDLIGALDEAIEAALNSEHAARKLITELGAEAAERARRGTWPVVPLVEALGDGGAIQTGPFGSQLHQSDYLEVGTAVVMPTNMKDGRVAEDGIARIGDADASRLARHRLRAGDIAWSRRGDVTRFAVISAEQEGMICGTGCFLVRPADPMLTAWLEVSLSTPATGMWLKDHAVGATMPNLNTGILGAVPVVLPPEGERPAFAGALLALREVVESSSSFTKSARRVRDELLAVVLTGDHEIPASYDRFIDGASAA